MVNAIVLAGTDNKRLVKGENKGFLKINGRYVVDYVIDTLRNSQKIDNIAIIGPESKLDEIKFKYRKENGRIKTLNEKSGFLENALAGYEALPKTENKYTFFIGSDIPLVTKQAINEFILECESCPEKKGADFYFPIIKKESIGEYNALKRKYVHLKEGDYRISNFALVNVENVKNKDFVNECFNFRKVRTLKTHLKILYNFPEIMWKHYVSRDLNRDYIEKKLSEIFECKFRLIETACPETSIDIDDEKDYNFLRSLILLGKSKKPRHHALKGMV